MRNWDWREGVREAGCLANGELGREEKGAGLLRAGLVDVGRMKLKKR